MLLAERIHALPKTGVLIGDKLFFCRERIERFVLEDAGVVAEIILDAPIHHEESAVDETGLALWLFLERGNFAVGDF